MYLWEFESNIYAYIEKNDLMKGYQMDFQDIMFRYGFVAGKRFHSSEKLRFLRGAAKEFIERKMAVDVKEARHAQRRAYNLYAGDYDNADIVLSAYYDTPPKTFGLIKHKVYNEKNDKRSFRLAMLLPNLVIILLGALFLFFGMKGIRQDGVFNFKDVLIVIPVIILVFLLFRSRNGIGNRVNLVRNTSSILACIKLADELTNRERKKLAIAFTDFGCVNHFGDIMLREVLQDQADKKTVILLDCIGSDDDLHVIYHKSSQQTAQLLKDAAKEANYKIDFEEIDDKDLKHYNLFLKSILITSGKKKNSDIVVNNVNTRKDSSVNEENINNVVTLLKALYSF